MEWLVVTLLQRSHEGSELGSLSSFTPSMLPSTPPPLLDLYPVMDLMLKFPLQLAPVLVLGLSDP